MPPPIYIYYLGESKLLEDREKIDNDDKLKACLDTILNWDVEFLPEILFHFGSSPTSAPDKVFGKPSARSSHSSRSGQAEYNAGILRRDLNKCVFCETTENLSAAHLLAYKNIRFSTTLESVFEKCSIGSVQDIANNGITACKDCHVHFDHHWVGVNPENMRVEVSRAFLDSKDPKVKEKWGPINGKYLKLKSNMGHWPSVDVFREKYLVFCEGRDKRRAKQNELRFQCDQCLKYLKTEIGVKQHKSRNGCAAYKANANKMKYLVSPHKVEVTPKK